MGKNIFKSTILFQNNSFQAPVEMINLKIDSQTCIDLANAEHINLKHHVIRDKVHSKFITLLKTKSYFIYLIIFYAYFLRKTYFLRKATRIFYILF